MINEPLYLLATLLILLAILFAWSNHPRWGKIFNYFPLLILIYFVPMSLSNLGIIPYESPVYVAIKKWLLPASLVLMTLSVDIPGIMRLGPKLVGLFFSATIGVLIGGPIAFALFAPFVPEGFRNELWKGFSALTASWIGGGANFVAVGESVKASADIMGAMVVADVGVASVWMAILFYFASKEKAMDSKINVDRTALDELIRTYEKSNRQEQKQSTMAEIMTIFAVGLGVTAACSAIAKQLPDIGTIINGFTWVVILVTTVGVALSFTPLRNLESKGASKMGSVFLYLLIVTIGASGNLRKVVDMPMIVLAASVWMAIHAMVVLGVRRWLKAPIFFAAVGSQANIGAAASAPVVAAAFHPALAPIGVLLAILGYVLGTYLGIVQAFVFEMISKMVLPG